MHHPIVTRVQQNSDSGARNGQTAVDGSHVPLHETHTTHGFVHSGYAKFSQFFNGRFVRAGNVAFHNSEFCHVQSNFKLEKI
jgi:hypothetical protein